MAAVRFALRCLAALAGATLLGGCAMGFNPQREPMAVEIPAEGVEVPITLVRNVPFVQVRVGDSEGLWFIVDTGCFACLIDDDAAAQLGMKRRMRFGSSVTSAGKQFGRLDLVAFESLTIGGATFGDFEGMVTDLSELAGVIEHPFQGVIGGGLIDSGVWTIDYPGETLRIRPASYELARDERTLPLVWREMMPTIMIRVGEKEFSAEIDTGSTGGLGFSHEDGRRLSISRDGSNRTRHATLNGDAVEEVARLDATVTIGPLTLERPMVRLGRDTVLGGEVFRECAFTIDCARQLVRIEKMETE